MTRTLKALAAAAATVLSLEAAAGAYTDLWYNPQESGWGVNVVQQLETAFVTLFTYGADGKPTWYFASDARITAYSGSGLPLFSGTLYKAEGPWHGGPFDPSKFKATPVGSIDLEVLAKSSMRVHYRAEGVDTVRQVVRQTWDQGLQVGNYVAQFVLRVTTPQGTLIGTRDFAADAILHLLGNEGYLRTDLHGGGRCEYRGPYQQSGKLLAFSGNFTCDSGDARAGTFEFRDVESNDNGFTGQLRTFSANVSQSGRVGAVRR